MSDVILYYNAHEIENTYRIWEEILSEKYGFADNSYWGEWIPSLLHVHSGK